MISEIAIIVVIGMGMWWFLIYPTTDYAHKNREIEWEKKTRKQAETTRKTLERLLAEHIRLCSAVYSKSERDNCVLEKLIIQELAAQERKL